MGAVRAAMDGADMSRPWFKFSPASWRGEPKLRMCSLSARGLWIDLLSYMAEGEPYGHFLIDGKQPTLEQMASLVGRPLKEIRSAVSELENNGVFSRRDDGAIYSRRMVRDKAREDQDKANGKTGGNPKLSQKDNRGVNPPDKAKNLELRTKNQESKQDARAILACRTAIVAAFEKSNSPHPPDTSRVSVWAAQGYDLTICSAVIAEGIARKPSISSLKYFDGAISEAHEKRSNGAGLSGHAAASTETTEQHDARLRRMWDAWKLNCRRVGAPIRRVPDAKSPRS